MFLVFTKTTSHENLKIILILLFVSTKSIKFHHVTNTNINSTLLWDINISNLLLSTLMKLIYFFVISVFFYFGLFFNPIIFMVSISFP